MRGAENIDDSAATGELPRDGDLVLVVVVEPHQLLDQVADRDLHAGNQHQLSVAGLLRRRRRRQQGMDAADHQIELTVERRIERPRPAALSAGEEQFPPAGLRNHQHSQIDLQFAGERLDFSDDAIDQIEFGQGGDQRGIPGGSRAQQGQSDRAGIHSPPADGPRGGIGQIIFQDFTPIHRSCGLIFAHFTICCSI